MNDSAHAPDSQHRTVDVLNLRLRVRDDLIISLQAYGGETCYLIEDPLSSRFYRVGLAEYTLLSLLDGNRTIAEAIGRTAELTGQDAMAESDTVAFCKWLVDAELASTPQSRTGGRLSEASEVSRRQRIKATLGPMFQRIPLSRPDDLATRMLPLARWLFSPAGAAAWLAVVLLGGCSLALHWQEFVTSGASILAPNNWLYLAGAWLALKLIHESAHALACKRYGGDVSEAGVMLVLLAPLPYVDVTSAWRFDSKWKRIMVSSAGMAAELMVAAVAGWIWCRSDPGMARQTAQNMVVAAGFMTLLFNANPLMRFDGYYILSDLLELPNLSTHASQWMRQSMRRLLIGGAASRPPWPENRTRIVAAYAIAALVWRILICITLIIVAEAMFFGAGVVIAALAVGIWFVKPAVQFVLEAARNPSARQRAVILLGSVASAGVVAWTALPWYTRVSAPAIVDYWPLTEVRSRVEGFVAELPAREGADVAADELLVQLRNPELELQAERLRVEVRQSQLRSRAFRSHGELPAFQIENRNRESLLQRLQQVESELTRLEVRAPHAGTVIDLPLRWKQGALVKPGTPLLSLGAEQDRRIHVIVPQQHLKAFKSRAQREVEVHFWGHTSRHSTARLVHVNPRGSTDLLHPALASVAGGPLEVRVRTPSGESDGDQWELTQPHFLAVAMGDAAKSAHLGQTGFVRFWRYDGTMGQVFLYRFARWLEDRRNQAQRQWQQN